MDVVFKMFEDGGFVAGDRDSGMTSTYAYPCVESARNRSEETTRSW